MKTECEIEVQLFDYDSSYSESKSSSSYWNRGWNIGKVITVDELIENIKLMNGAVSFALFLRFKNEPTV